MSEFEAMMDDPVLAHRLEDGTREQTPVEHLRETGRVGIK
jgi:hypothetical protein